MTYNFKMAGPVMSRWLSRAPALRGKEAGGIGTGLTLGMEDLLFFLDVQGPKNPLDSSARVSSRWHHVVSFCFDCLENFDLLLSSLIQLGLALKSLAIIVGKSRN